MTINSAGNFYKLASQISLLLQSKPHVFVAISGFGGSGKTSLANQLRDYFKISDEQVLRIDHLYSENPDGPGMLDQVDWLLLEDILKNAHQNKPFSFTGRGYRNTTIPVNALLPSVVIVEGIRLLQPSLLKYFDISVWIDCPQEVAIERAKARDRAQGEQEEVVSLWDTDWGPKDKKYYETFQPQHLATFVY